ncbi:two-component system sensor histidine kinase ChiS [Paenibacillus phyllosphaerae]|uniref:Oxygen sensor histidine kinase NreB n=1 Tax=Paenibacillus phyllosphaerae TaxID=274593 RepID=A0A7W5B0R4_9BACL|nr:ATP-binding protein [Paenibacillus phyllosphaerae]MBB3112238.1 two-component system sensor histidine kinase ChiS [Paenibacillus phyllosphaerae]
MRHTDPHAKPPITGPYRRLTAGTAGRLLRAGQYRCSPGHSRQIARSAFTLPIAVLLLAALVLPLLHFALLPKQVHAESVGSQAVEERQERQIRFVARWEAYFGEEPGPNAVWMPLDEAAHRRLPHYEGTLWLKRAQLPAIPGRDPYLFIYRMRHMDVYLDDKPVYSFNMERPDSYVNPNAVVHQIRLHASDEGKSLTLKLLWNREALPLYWNTFGERQFMEYAQIEQDWPMLVYATVFVLFGTASLAMFIRRPKEQLYGWFTLLTYCAGFGIASLIASWQFYADGLARLYYFRDMLLPLGIWAFLGFYGTAMGREYARIYRVLLAVMGAYTLLTAISAFANPLFYIDLLIRWLPYVMIAIFAVVTWTLILTLRTQRSSEMFWLSFGYVSLLVFGFVHVIRNYVTADANTRPWPWFIELLLQYALPIGMLLFLFGLVMVLIGRFANVHKQLKQVADELVARNEAMAQFDQLKDDFLRNTSHELRTPLHGIAGLTESLLGGAAGPVSKPMADNLQLVLASSGRLLGLVNDILDLYRLKHRDVRLTLADVHLRRTAEAVAASLAPLAARKGLLVNVEADLPELVIQADPGRFEQVLYNLVGNAIRYTESGQVTVSIVSMQTKTGEKAGRLDDPTADESIRQEDEGIELPLPADAAIEQIEITVADTGKGIPEEQMQRLFEPFAAAEHQLGGGTGLGLSITRRLVELHGGTIGVVSSPKGTRVTFTLPALEPRLAANISKAESPLSELGTESEQDNDFDSLAQVLPLAPPALSPPSADLLTQPSDPSGEAADDDEAVATAHRPLILIADDEPINLQVLRHYMRHADYELIEAADGLEAIAMLGATKRKPDLLLLDVMMPGMTGYDVCRKVRERYSASELPIILLSARDRTIDLVQGFDAGANDYVTKPFSQGELMARMNIQLKLAQFHLSLEQLVAVRTSELEEANKVLAGSVRETAEALAEVSVLEERNRIAHEMHDVVGHSLTAAIVQMEAAKKLAPRDLDQALARVDTAGGMVRKGLDEIRRTVRMLKDEEQSIDLASALQELIRETSSNAGVQIHARIEPLPPMSGLKERILYHALMEGMTNGLRHGRCSAFHFELRHEEDALLFQLTNDGEAYGNAKPGFGLSAMMERVHLLGGTVDISSGRDPRTGEVAGCVLLIRLPLQRAA